MDVQRARAVGGAVGGWAGGRELLGQACPPVIRTRQLLPLAESSRSPPPSPPPPQPHPPHSPPPQAPPPAPPPLPPPPTRPGPPPASAASAPAAGKCPPQPSALHACPAPQSDPASPLHVCGGGRRTVTRRGRGARGAWGVRTRRETRRARRRARSGALTHPPITHPPTRNAVCVDDRGEAVRHHHRGAPHHQLVQSLLHHVLRLGVQSRGGLVQQQDLCGGSTGVWDGGGGRAARVAGSGSQPGDAAQLGRRCHRGEAAGGQAAGGLAQAGKPERALALGSLRIARAIAMRCFCPPLICTPFSPTWVSYLRAP